jgi:hypothetical protein
VEYQKYSVGPETWMEKIKLTYEIIVDCVRLLFDYFRLLLRFVKNCECESVFYLGGSQKMRGGQLRPAKVPAN